MRQIFSSQRVETVEGVAELLRSHDIEVRVTDGRTYHTKRRGQFSYLDQNKNIRPPTVWVVRADDQPKAREILRDARLLDTTRRDHPTAEFAFREPAAATSGRGWAWRIRIALLVVIAGVALFIAMGHRGAQAPQRAPAAPAPAAQPQPVAPTPSAAPEEEEEVRVRIQPAAPQR